MSKVSDAQIERENILRDVDPEDMMVLDEILFGEDLGAEIGEMGPWTATSKARAMDLGLIAWEAK